MVGYCPPLYLTMCNTISYQYTSCKQTHSQSYSGLFKELDPSSEITLSTSPLLCQGVNSGPHGHDCALDRVQAHTHPTGEITAQQCPLSTLLTQPSLHNTFSDLCHSSCNRPCSTSSDVVFWQTAGARKNLHSHANLHVPFQSCQLSIKCCNFLHSVVNIFYFL